MRIAIDTGGTFTDCVFVRDGRLEILKVFSTPANPARAIVDSLKQVRGGETGATAPFELLHGTTVGTNAVLTRNGARVALVTTEGFEDVLAIGRQAREQLYDFSFTRPPALIPARRRLGVTERMGPRGEVLTALNPQSIKQMIAQLRRVRPEAIAVSLLFSFINPAHER